MSGNNLAKGTLYLAISQIAVALSGYAIHIFLGRFLTPAEYGLYAIIISVATIPNLVLATGVPQAVSKYISEDSMNSPSVRAQGIRLQLILGSVVFITYLLASYPIAYLLNDMALVPYLQLSTIVIPLYALYALYVMILNGEKRYREQSFNVIVFSATKSLLVIFLVLIGFSVSGAVFGFSISPLVGLVLGVFLIRHIPKTADRFSAKKLISFAIPVTIFWISYQLIMSIDLLAVKALLPDSDAQAGYYSAASMISRTAYFLVTAISYAFFPAISTANRANDYGTVKLFIRESNRYIVMILTLMVVGAAFYGTEIVTFLYGTAYLSSGIVLGILMLGMSFFSVFTYLLSVLSAGSRPRIAMVLGVFTLAIDFILNILLVPTYGINGAAWATTIASGVGLVLSSTAIFYVFDCLISPISVTRIIISGIVTFGVVLFLHLNVFGFIIGGTLTTLIFSGLLFMTRELNNDDFARVRSFIK